MRVLSFLSLFLVGVGCAFQAHDRSPSSSSSLEAKISKTQEKLERLEKMRYASRSEVFVEFQETGSLGKGKYKLKARFFSNHIEEIESVEVLIRGDAVRELSFVLSEGVGLIDESVPFHLPLAHTHLRFTLRDGDVRDVELECTVLGGCQR